MKVTRQELINMYNSMNTKELCEKLGYRSPSSLYALLKRQSIPLKGDESLRKRGAVEVVESA